MEPYWSYSYPSIESMGAQDIALYKYSQKSIALKCSPEFGRAFSKHLKKSGGKFNMNLKFCPIPEPGWIFKIEDQSNIQEFISAVQKGTITPKIFDEKSVAVQNIALFRKLKELMDLIPEQGETDYILSETNGYRTYLTFDDNDDEGRIFSVKSANKVMNVHQIKIKL
jgi:hypothetical protein